MHSTIPPHLVYRWKRARFMAACGVPVGYGPSMGAERHEPDLLASEMTGGLEGGAFGVRRPLRLLTYKLGLDEAQVTQMARILNDLKTERAQAAVDDRRTLTAFAEALVGENFDKALAEHGSALRKKGAERLGEAVIKALGQIHKLLNPEQRERLAYLIRTGTLVF